jgi:dienelactone hydrolase
MAAMNTTKRTVAEMPDADLAAPTPLAALRVTHPVELQVGRARLHGDLTLPPGARGLVVFAHGSGSGRLSPRNQFVARTLEQQNIGTLLFDLLTPDEERDDADGHLRFDVRRLARRLLAVTQWLRRHEPTAALTLGYFGASTGAAAALLAAAAPAANISAVVSRGGRPDLASTALARVQAPTLLIVGSNDDMVLDLNREALDRLHGPKQLAVVGGATHLFEEPGALEHVAALAAQWFERHLHR